MSPPRLENRLPPEDLLERDEHPLRELALLLMASLLALAVLVLIAGFAARWLARAEPGMAEGLSPPAAAPERLVVLPRQASRLRATLSRARLRCSCRS